MVRIIESARGLYRGTKCLYVYLNVLYNKCYYPVKLRKPCNVSKNVYIGNKWEDLSLHVVMDLYTNTEYWCWKPLGFEKGILYG